MERNGLTDYTKVVPDIDVNIDFQNIDLALLSLKKS